MLSVRILWNFEWNARDSACDPAGEPNVSTTPASESRPSSGPAETLPLLVRQHPQPCTPERSGEIEWVRNSRVLVASLRRSLILIKEKRAALCAPVAVRFSQPGASSGDSLSDGKCVPKSKPAVARPHSHSEPGSSNTAPCAEPFLNDFPLSWKQNSEYGGIHAVRTYVQQPRAPAVGAPQA
jgi:hypothetical protein